MHQDRRRAVVMLLTLLAAGPSRAQQSQDGISADAYRRNFPPAPVAVRAERRGGRIIVTWDPPPAADPSERLAYDPAVDRYRVYRVAADRARTLAGETRTTSFVDPAAPAGAVQRYVVTAVQRSGQESAPSHDAAVQTPR
jgi:fibronectin type 3 domain-containing protein